MKIEVNLKTGYLESHKNLVPLQGDLKSYESKKGREALKSSILTEGIIYPTFIWESDGIKYIWDGHGRQDIYEELATSGVEIPELPVVYILAKNKADAKLKLLKKEQDYRRRIGKDGFADFINGESIKVDDLEGLNLPGLGELDISFLEGIMENSNPAVPEKPPIETAPIEPPVNPTSKTSEIYQLGRHRLMCGDSTNIKDIEKLLNGSKIDFILTDPPYGINESGDRLSRGGAYEGQKYQDFKDDSIEYAVKAFNICSNMDVKTQVWWGANYYCHHLPQANNWLIWDKRVEEKQTDFNSDCELAWVKSSKNSCRIFRHLWKGMIKGSEHGKKRIHPTQKPIALAEHCFDRYDHGSKNILDLFGGSGSTLIACENTGRSCFIMELEPAYIDVIIDRWERHTGKKATKIN